MYLSELVQVSEFINEKAAFSIVSGIYRSFGGTLLKLYGRELSGIYFNTREKVLFPVSDLSRFKKEPLTRLEEGLRSNISGRMKSISALTEYGKLVRIELFDSFLLIPLFNGKAVRIVDKNGALIWSEKGAEPLELLKNPMKEYPVKNDDPFFYELDFIEKMKEKKEDDLERAVEKKREKILSSLKTFKDQLEKMRSDILKYSEYGKIIKAALYSLSATEKKEVLEVNDLSGKTVRLTLDPAKTVVENMDRFFSKVKKGKRGIIYAEKRIAELNLELETLGKIDISETAENAIENEEKRKKPKRSLHKPYREFHSNKGRVFLVGKGAKDNDELTFKIASMHDMWFHVKDNNGSHVIMKMRKGENPQNSDILTGCRLAVIYSKSGKGKSGEVWFTQRKNVMKKKGMAAGKVMFKNAKSLYLKDVEFPENLIKLEG